MKNNESRLATLGIVIIISLFIGWLVYGWNTGYDKVCKYYDHHSEQYCRDQGKLYQGLP